MIEYYYLKKPGEKMTYTCPVCVFDELDDPAYDDYNLILYILFINLIYFYKKMRLIRTTTDSSLSVLDLPINKYRF